MIIFVRYYLVARWDYCNEGNNITSDEDPLDCLTALFSHQ